ncbi:hypothetical protein [Oleiagrimonas sp.]|jgi:outer membrane protein assembly factor BamB|uniref:YncE family protein n=1 Tax=Oleiagrimonas sp. TaxID=2010330 RepID=UPI002610169F|nr:hypothetical protein [Oleiagrimonas sp.]MDA3912874.1 hypothetical protein [Oleiagrimonas sp.]
MFPRLLRSQIMLGIVVSAFFALPAWAAMHTSSLPQRVLQLNGSGKMLDLDDMIYAPSMHRVLVPAAQSGALVLINPATQHMTHWNHVVPGGSGAERDDAGTTSAAVGSGFVFVSDHKDQELVALNPQTHQPVARARLASGPDYVRYVATLKQVWVTEPGASQIERFQVRGGAHPMLSRVGAVAVNGGPESLVIDARRGMAYTNQWKSHTLEISLHHPALKASWANTCRGSRGLALDAADGVLLVGCKEGKVVALDPASDGKILGHAKVGAGVDIIAWNPVLRHVYAPGARSATLSVLTMDPRGRLKRVATAPAAPHAHCVTTDGRRHVYVCDPAAGAVISYTDHVRP